MNAPNLRTASHALDASRPVVARLDVARNPEDVAADIIEAWSAAETALRAMLGGSSLEGQALIRELRTRQVLDLDQGHALLGFLGARDRVARTEYRPTAADVQAAREGYQRLESAVMTGQAGAYGAPGAGAAGAPAAPVADVTYVSSEMRRRRSPVLAIVLGVVLLGALAGLAWWMLEVRNGPRALEKGVAAYRNGQTNEARAHFAQVARHHPDLATPHVYLARLARDEGNLPTALQELQTAIRLEPTNALALREMGAYLYTTGQFDLARKFYVRTLQANPRDREASGFLGCTMLRLGRPQEGQAFLQRAGQGAWSACAQQAPPPGYQPQGFPQQRRPGP